MPPPEQVFILSKLFGMEQVAMMPFAGRPTEAVMATEPSTASLLPPHVSGTATAPAFSAFGLAWQLLAGSVDTGGAYNLFELSIPAGAWFGAWVHAQDQALYVLEAGAQVLLDDRIIEAKAGTFVFVPAGVVNAVRAGADGARLLMLHLPGALDRAVAGLGGEASADGGRLRDYLDAIGTRAVAAPGGW